jgi:hypothetical protein
MRVLTAFRISAARSVATAGILLSVAAAASPLSSSLTLPAATTAYAPGQLVANSPSAVVTPQFLVPSGPPPLVITRVRLSTNDPMPTAWGGETVVVDLWSAAPSFLGGDRSPWVIVAGAAAHLATLACTMSVVGGDGAWAECAPRPARGVSLFLEPGSPVYWSLRAASGSGVTGSSRTFTLTAELAGS